MFDRNASKLLAYAVVRIYIETTHVSIRVFWILDKYFMIWIPLYNKKTDKLGYLLIKFKMSFSALSILACITNVSC